MAKKLQSSLAVEGELPEDGLAAYGDDGDDLMLALARKLVNGNEDDAADTVEAAFGNARAAETESEEYLVDDEWKPTETAIPSIMEVNSDANVRGSDAAAARADGSDPDMVGQGVEFASERGFAAVNGNGHSPVTETEPAVSPGGLFSWAEFMAEQSVTTGRRNRKPNLLSSSLFEWALSVEQEKQANRKELAAPA